MTAPALAAPAAAARFDWFDYRGDDGQPKPGAGEYAQPDPAGLLSRPERASASAAIITSSIRPSPGSREFRSSTAATSSTGRQIGNAIDRPGQLNFDKTDMWQGVFAPDISWHDGIFYIAQHLRRLRRQFRDHRARIRRGRGPIRCGCPTSTASTRRCSSTTTARAWIVHNGAAAGHAALRGPYRDLAAAVRSEDAEDRRPKRLLVDAGIASRTQPDLDRGSAHLQEGRPLLSDRGRRRHRGRPFGGRVPKRQGDRPYAPFAGNPILTQRDLPKDRRRPITSTGHARSSTTPERRLVGGVPGRPALRREQFQHRARDLPDAGPVAGRLAADH